jgi:hypothetical protein
MRSVTSLTILALASFAVATAQELPLQPGQLVRVTCAPVDLDNTKAVVVALRRDALMLQYERFRVDAHGGRHRDTLVTEVPVASVTRLAVHRGQRSAWASGLVYGLVGGALAGGVLGLASGDDPPGWFSMTAGEKAGLGAVAFGALGGIGGLVIGALTKSDKWEQVPLDRLRVSVVPTQRGFGLGASIAF